MKDFKGKVAVVTGAAGGIGRALAERWAREGMKVVLADIEAGALTRAEREIKALGIETMAVQTDVSKASDVEALAQKTMNTFGAVHLLCNNAGVGAGLSAWESTLQDWQWVLGVNLWGVIYGVHYFVPLMIKQKFECHIVNTASIAGLVTNFDSVPYTVSKHGVVSLSELLYKQLQQKEANIGVSVLCPASVKTGIIESERNRPAGLKNKPDEGRGNLGTGWEAHFTDERHFVDNGAPPEKIADIVFDAVVNKKFYIIPDLPVAQPELQARWESIIRGNNPPLPHFPPK